MILNAYAAFGVLCVPRTRARDPTERPRVPAHFTRYRWTLSQGLTASDTATREQPSIWGENIIFGHASPHSLARGIPQICPGWGMEPPQQNKGVGVGVVMSRRKQNGCSDTSPCHHARGASHSRKHAPHQIHQGENTSEPRKVTAEREHQRAIQGTSEREHQRDIQGASASDKRTAFWCTLFPHSRHYSPRAMHYCMLYDTKQNKRVYISGAGCTKGCILFV